MRSSCPYLAPLVVLLVAGCVGDLGDAAARPRGAPGPTPTGPVIAPAGMRRLTAAEYDQTIGDLLGVEDVSSVLSLPEDRRNPFDNDSSTQEVSQALIEGAELLASDVWAAVSADAALRDRLVGCTPTGAADAACMQSFVESFGRRALRRPLDAAEVAVILQGEGEIDGALDMAMLANDFYAGVGLAFTALLQDPEFLYRIEIGEALEGGVHRLNDFEIATRLSYLVWGSTPDDALLDRAEEGRLHTSEEIDAELTRMLTDRRAIDRMVRFHAMWLGYEQSVLPGSELSDAMLAESGGLVERVLFTDARPWQDVFTSDETYVSDVLAEHYGMPLPGSETPVWVPYDIPQRRGILSHATFLSLGRAFGDSSPVQRGLAVRRRLLCQTIPPPPPTVDIDQRPSSDTGYCKEDRYAAHSSGGCAGCHSQMDPVGFGLESFDLAGRYRTTEPDNPSTPEDESMCMVRAEGQLIGIGAFSGPAELGELALSSGLLNRCLITQVYRFAVGRSALTSEDTAIVASLDAAVEDEFDMATLLRLIVTHDSFRHRRELPAAPGGM